MNSINELMEEIDRRIEAGEVGIAEASVITKRMNNAVRSTFPKKEDGVTREALKAGYEAVLQGCSKEHAKHILILKQGEDEAWWDVVKNKDCFIVKDVVTSFDNHPTQKRMMREKTMDKIAVKGSRSVNQLLKRIEHAVTIDSHVQEKKTEVAELKRSLEETKRRVAVLEQLPSNTSQSVKYYKEQGLKQTEVAQITGYSVRTVKRWW